jgi:hypothetical protein
MSFKTELGHEEFLVKNLAAAASVRFLAVLDAYQTTDAEQVVQHLWAWHTPHWKTSCISGLQTG